MDSAEEWLIQLLFMPEVFWRSGIKYLNESIVETVQNNL